MSKKETIEATETVETVETAEAPKKMKSIVDYMTETDYARYQELLAKAEDIKAKTPRQPRGPMTMEQKKKHAESRIAKLQEKLQKLYAGLAGETDIESDENAVTAE